MPAPLLGVTSGNLHIVLAFKAAQKGYKFIALMSAKLSLDKQILLWYLGAEVIFDRKKLIVLLISNVRW